MVLTLGLDIRLMRLFWRKKIAKPMGFAVDSNTCAPLMLKKNDPDKSRFVAAIRAANILRVSSWIDYAKIAQSVIMLIAVHMVDKTLRPFSVRQQPRKPMRFVDFSAITDSDVFSGKVARNVAWLNSFGNSLLPCQKTSFRVVAKDGAQMFSDHAFNAYLKTTKGQA